MSAMTSQITCVSIVFPVVFFSGADQRKHHSSVSQALVGGIQRWPVNSMHKGPVTRKMFSFDDVIMRGILSLHLFIRGGGYSGNFPPSVISPLFQNYPILWTYWTPKQWQMGHISDLMMIIRLSERILTIIIREMGKLNTHSPIYCTKYNWENWLNLRHTLDKMYLANILDVQYLQIRPHNDENDVV